MGIKISLLVDGYQIVKDESLFYLDKSGNDFIFDQFFAYGEAHKDLLKDHHKIPQNQIHVVRPSFLEKVTKTQSLSNIKYDAIIMSYHPNQHNPNARWDYGLHIVADIIKTLLDLGKNKIAVKVKSGLKGEESIEGEKYLKFLQQINLMHSIEIIKGEFSTHIHKTNQSQTYCKYNCTSTPNALCP